ncbi:MAG: recombinase RecA [Bacteroidetes bacterium]|nr:MAG: recombinase RecA [Bacteroidota bacterium]
MSKALELLEGLGVTEAVPAIKEVTKELEKPLTTLTKAEKQKAAIAVAKSLNKQYQTALLQNMGKRVGQRLPSIPTDMPSFDETICGCGGVPRGRVVEIFGPEASGKTTIALHIIAAAQKSGGMAAFIDAEHALDPSYASRIGVDVDELLISQPDYGEQALEVAEALVDSRAVDVIVIDSVSALVPKAELDGDMGDSHMGLQARLMSQAMRKLTGKCSRNGVTIIFINQIREKLGVMFGNPETTTGGRALKFYASLRIKIRQLSKTDGGIIEDSSGTRIGQRCHLEAVKNKCGGAPYAKTELSLYYASGWDTVGDLIDYAESLQVIEETSKGWYSFKGEKYRKNDLTEGQAVVNIRIAVEKAIEAKRETDAKKEQEAVKE